MNDEGDCRTAPATPGLLKRKGEGEEGGRKKTRKGLPN